jgi:hypothetical protein
LDEQHENAKLRLRQLDRYAGRAADRHGVGVDFNRTETHGSIVARHDLCERRRRINTAARDGAQPRKHLAQRERLRQIIIGTPLDLPKRVRMAAIDSTTVTA